MPEIFIWPFRQLEHIISLAFSQRLVIIVWLTVQSHIPLPNKALNNLIHWQFGSRNWRSKGYFEHKNNFVNIKWEQYMSMNAAPTHWKTASLTPEYLINRNGKFALKACSSKSKLLNDKFHLWSLHSPVLTYWPKLCSSSMMQHVQHKEWARKMPTFIYSLIYISSCG